MIGDFIYLWNGCNYSHNVTVFWKQLMKEFNFFKNWINISKHPETIFSNMWSWLHRCSPPLGLLPARTYIHYKHMHTADEISYDWMHELSGKKSAIPPFLLCMPYWRLNDSISMKSTASEHNFKFFFHVDRSDLSQPFTTTFLVKFIWQYKLLNKYSTCQILQQCHKKKEAQMNTKHLNVLIKQRWNCTMSFFVFTVLRWSLDSFGHCGLLRNGFISTRIYRARRNLVGLVYFFLCSISFFSPPIFWPHIIDKIVVNEVQKCSA